MKKSIWNSNHQGIQPIRVLKHNITHRLVDRNKELITTLQKSGVLDYHINYYANNLPLKKNQTPSINDKNVISIHENFLSYIWIVTYTIFVLYEEGIVIPDHYKRNIPFHKKQNPQLMDLVKELFDYSKSLITSYTPWDKDYLPNPEYFDEYCDEGYYVLRTNDLYVEVMNFILYHEIAHGEFDHLKIKNQSKLKGAQLKKIELEADSRAINLLLNSKLNTTKTELGITFGIMSLLFFKADLYGGSEHPDVDQRLENYLQIIKPKDDSQIWAILVLFMKLWGEQFSYKFVEKPGYENFKILFYELLQQAKNINLKI